MSSEFDVFISYKREEHTLADLLAAGLEEAGYSHVSDVNLQYGDQFGDAIDRMIRASRIVVVLWTQASAGSDWVKSEARLGVQLNKYLGVMVEKTDLPVDLAFKHYEDLDGRPFAQSIASLVQIVGQRLGPPSFAPNAAATKSVDLNDDLRLFETSGRIGTAEAYEIYLASFPNGVMADFARQRVSEQTTWSTRVLRLFPSAAAVAAAAALFTALIQTFQTEQIGGWFRGNTALTAAKDEIDALLVTVEETTAQRDDLNAKLDEQIGIAAALKEELASRPAAAEFTSRLADIDSLQSELEIRDVRLDEARAQLDRLNADLAFRTLERDELMLGLQIGSAVSVFVPRVLGATSVRELSGAVVCVLEDYPPGRTTTTYLRGWGIYTEELLFESDQRDEMISQYEMGACDAQPFANTDFDAFRALLSKPEEHIVLSLR